MEKNISCKYLFSWSDVPGKDEKRLINYLKKIYEVEWVKNARITKTSDRNTIKVTNPSKSDPYYVLLTLNVEKTKVDLVFWDGKTDQFNVKNEDGQLNIYICKINEKLLEYKTESSDRFVNSSYFIPFNVNFSDSDLAIIPEYKKNYLKRNILYGMIDRSKLTEHLSKLKLGELLKENNITLPETISSPEKLGLKQSEAILSSEQETYISEFVKSDVGYLFLDRTRIRPKGFAIGEHVYTLSLAPGEEVVLEQRAFSKRQITLEEQSEMERQLDIELSSTLSTEIQEGLERKKSLTDRAGLSLSHTGQYQSPMFFWGQVTANSTIGYAKDITEANDQTLRRSVKDSQSASSKVASKYRSLHKLSFKISTEEGFESTSKRVIKNPNKFTPIDLNYFKILKLNEMRQERYGVRLCWAPFVREPATDFFNQILNGRQTIIKKAESELSSPPIQPEKKATENEPAKETKWKMVRKEADKWIWPFGSMRDNYDIEVTIDTGWHWEGFYDVRLVTDNMKGRTAGMYIIGKPYEGTNKDQQPVVIFKVNVEAGIGWEGAHIYIDASIQLVKDQTTAVTDDAAFNARMTEYLNELKAWNEMRDKKLDEARKRAYEWEQEMISEVNPIAEMMNGFIKYSFPPSQLDDGWEVDYWQKIFEWEAASYILYPGWWSTLQMRDYLKGHSDFVNASWARLFLPVRIGMELEALMWIFYQTTNPVEVHPAAFPKFEKIRDELKAKRLEWFENELETSVIHRWQGDELVENFLTLASWTEVMPTDGTHIEVIQSVTSTVDDYTDADLRDTSNLRQAVLDNEKQDIEIKKKALSMITKPTCVKVVVKTDTEAKES